MRGADVGGRQAGRRAEPAQASPGCRQIYYLPTETRLGFARLPLVY